MKSSTFTFTDKDRIEIFVYKWEPDAEPKAVIQILHGLAEHAKRYTRVAEALCKEGYICYADDHRGHGLTAGDLTEATLDGNAGVLGSNGWRGVVNDAHELSIITKKENPNLPLFLLGHSWGAMLTQDYIQEWGNEIQGCILSGTNGISDKSIREEGIKIAKGEIEKIGPTAPSTKLDNMSFKSINKRWQNEDGATGFEWLSRDKAEVQKYIDDPWCGFIGPATLWLELFKGNEKIYNPEYEKKIPKELPIYIISGTLDPVGNYSFGIIDIVNRFKNYGIKDVTHKLYKNARHELFNEINRNEVFEDLTSWLNSHL
ncbi:MAG: alpha/beta hydrolase [Candidatus Hodarchaeota archaeon]